MGGPISDAEIEMLVMAASAARQAAYAPYSGFAVGAVVAPPPVTPGVSFITFSERSPPANARVGETSTISAANVADFIWTPGFHNACRFPYRRLDARMTSKLATVHAKTTVPRNRRHSSMASNMHASGYRSTQCNGSKSRVQYFLVVSRKRRSKEIGSSAAFFRGCMRLTLAPGY